MLLMTNNQDQMLAESDLNIDTFSEIGVDANQGVASEVQT
jgi:hypothetical protein